MRCRKLLDMCGCKYVADVSASRMQLALGELIDAGTQVQVVRREGNKIVVRAKI